MSSRGNYGFLFDSVMFHCGQYAVVHISVVDPDVALEDGSPFRDDDPNDVICKPETKTYVELTAFP